jgi:hypothetical protein
MQIAELIGRIDYQRIAGINRILGVDWTGRYLRVVELEKQGNPLNKFNSVYKAVTSFVHEFNEEKSIDDKSSKLKSLLNEKGIKTKYVVTSVRSAGFKTVTTVIPATDMYAITEWVKDHYEKLLKLPIPLDQLSFTVEPLQVMDSQTLAEVTFVRKKDYEEYKELFQKAGLDLLSIGAGTRDAVNPLLISDSFSKEGRINFLYTEENFWTCTTLQNIRRVEVRNGSLDGDNGSKEQLSGILQELKLGVDETLLSGSSAGNFISSGYKVFQPFNLATEYSLVSGLALKGHLPEISSTNFLDDVSKKRIDDKIYKSLFQRVTLTLGLVVLLLLTVFMGIEFIINSQMNQLDEQLLSSNAAYTEVAVLVQQVNNLKKNLQGTGNSLSSSHFGKLLHNFAINNQDKMWFYKLIIQDEQPSQQKILIAGYTISDERIAGFLKSLQKSGLCSEVSLLRSGTPTQTESGLPVSAKPSSFTMFEIEGKVKE